MYCLQLSQYDRTLNTVPEHFARVVDRADVRGRERRSGAGGENAWSNEVARLDHVFVRQHVRRRRLWIARRRHAIREVDEILERLRAVHAPRRPHVRVNVDIAGENRLAGDVDDLGTRRNVDFPLRTNGDDAVVLHDDIALGDHFVRTLHRENACAAQCDDTRRPIFRNNDVDVVTRRFVDRSGWRTATTTTTSAAAGACAAR